METIIIALVVALGSVLGPALLSHLNNRSRRAEKQEDYVRQDAVAAKAEEAAALLLERQDRVAAKAEEAASLLLAANERVAQNTTSTNDKLDVIHTLVNSNMTAAMQSEFDAVVRELAMMREVVDLKKGNGLKPSPESLEAIKVTQSKVNELQANLKDRLEQTKIADSQIFIAREREEKQQQQQQPPPPPPQQQPPVLILPSPTPTQEPPA